MLSCNCCSHAALNCNLCVRTVKHMLLVVLLSRYELIMEAFGGQSFHVSSSSQLAAACRIAFGARRPALINLAIDPMAGVESGNVHAFNAPKANL